MASGRVATTQLTGTYALSTVYTVPAGNYGVYNISFTNPTSGPLTIRLAVGASATPQPSEYIEYGTVIVANGVFERTGLVLAALQNIVASASAGSAGATSAISVNVYGIETSTT
jgi:acyl dehydratase